MSWDNDLSLAYGSLQKAVRALESAIAFNPDESFRLRMASRIQEIQKLLAEIEKEPT